MASEIIAGVNPIYEVLRAGRRKVERIWIASKETGKVVEKIKGIAGDRKISVQKSTREEIFGLSRIEKHQGIIAKVSVFEYSTLEEILEIGENDPKGHFLLILDNILDPQNLGSIIRTAHLSGVHGIIIPERNSASIGPASTRASAGAVEYIPIAQVVNITKTINLLKEKGIWVIGVEVGGENLYSQDISGSYAFVIGSEGKGIRRLVRENCDILASIPMNPTSDGVNSYNASVAAAILLSEANRQRNYKKDPL